MAADQAVGDDRPQSIQVDPEQVLAVLFFFAEKEVLVIGVLDKGVQPVNRFGDRFDLVCRIALGDQAPQYRPHACSGNV